MQIRLSDVHFAYTPGVPVLQGIDMHIETGEKLALIGENGAGKSTLARLVNGLLRPQTGAVWVGDWQASRFTPAQLARRVAYVFQNPDEQLFNNKVWDEVAFGPRNLGYDRSQVSEFTGQALHQAGLEKLAGENPRDLGYSTRRRVTLACALAMHTPILVLDEPTSGMDAREITALASLLAHLHQSGKTLILITHDLDFVAENMHRTIILHRGRITHDAPTAQVFTGSFLQGRSDELQLPQIPRLAHRLGLDSAHLTAESLAEALRRG